MAPFPARPRFLSEGVSNWPIPPQPSSVVNHLSILSVTSLFFFFFFDVETCPTLGCGFGECDPFFVSWPSCRDLPPFSIPRAFFRILLRPGDFTSVAQFSSYALPVTPYSSFTFLTKKPVVSPPPPTPQFTSALLLKTDSCRNTPHSPHLILFCAGGFSSPPRSPFCTPFSLFLDI